MVTTETALKYVKEYLDLQEEIKQLEKRKDALEEKLVNNYGKEIKGEPIGTKYRISTWIQVNTYIDSTGLKVKFPDVYDEFRKETKPFQRIRITVQK